MFGIISVYDNTSTYNYKMIDLKFERAFKVSRVTNTVEVLQDKANRKGYSKKRYAEGTTYLL